MTSKDAAKAKEAPQGISASQPRGRFVHAKGVAAHGKFTVTNDITHLTKAKFLNEIGKTTPLFSRFSPLMGGADGMRDARGFSFKLYTEEGNLDWVFGSTPTFPIRDGSKFPGLIECQKKDPQTGVQVPTAFWDFMSSNAETFNTNIFVYSDLGTPTSYRSSEIHSVNTYKFIPDTKLPSFNYVRITLKPNQPTVPLTQQEVNAKDAVDSNFYSKDLYDNIADGNFPSWDVYAQVIPQDEASKYKNLLDPTKRWSTRDQELIKFGVIQLDKNLDKGSDDVELACFDPTTVVPGWDVTEDPILQARLAAYKGAAGYRLGNTYKDLAVNKSRNLTAQLPTDPVATEIPQAKQIQPSEQDNEQPRELWDEFKRNSPMDEHLISNVAEELSLASKEIRQKTYAAFTLIAKDLGQRVEEATEGKVVK